MFTDVLHIEILRKVLWATVMIAGKAADCIGILKLYNLFKSLILHIG